MRLLVGRVVKAHGIRGEVVVDVVSDAPGRFSPGARMFDGDDEVTVATSRPHQGRLLVRFEHVADRNGAEAMRGVKLEIEADEAAPLEEGSYYPFQLEGLSVVHVDGSELGTMLRVEEGKAYDLWVVDAGGREVLVPAVAAIVRAVDLEGGRIVMDPPEDLF